MKPLVSIVIPTYNRERDLDRSIKSVLAQTYSNWEALIVDNHSRDNTVDLVQGFNDSRIKYFRIHNDGVIAASRNLGIKNAAGQFIAFLDSDDWWMPRKLEISLKYLEQGADVVYHDMFLVTKPEQLFYFRKFRTRDLKSPIFKDFIINGNALNNSSVLIRRGILKKINGLSEDKKLIAIEDYDLWLRAAKETEKFCKVPHVLGYYWAGGENYWVSKNIPSLERKISTLDHFEQAYTNELKNFDNGTVYWINYVKGITYYSIGDYLKSTRHLKLIRWCGVPFFIKIKSLWIMLKINFQNY